MIQITQHLKPAVAQSIRTMLQTLDDAYWRDRSKHKPNTGIEGKVGSYYSCADESMPKQIRTQIDAIAPVYDGYQLEGWVVNKTPRGGGMPPHVDNEGYFAIGILCLQSQSGCFEWYQNYERGHSTKVHDRAGQLIQFDDVRLIHSVPEALLERYVVVFLYR